jgi:hypothetical protein
MKTEKLFMDEISIAQYLRRIGATLIRAKPVVEDNGSIAYVVSYVVTGMPQSEAAVKYDEGRRRRQTRTVV